MDGINRNQSSKATHTVPCSTTDVSDNDYVRIMTTRGKRLVISPGLCRLTRRMVSPGHGWRRSSAASLRRNPAGGPPAHRHAGEPQLPSVYVINATISAYRCCCVITVTLSPIWTLGCRSAHLCSAENKSYFGLDTWFLNFLISGTPLHS